VVALTIGLEDYTADLGGQNGGRESLLACARGCAKALECSNRPVFGDVGDMGSLQSWAEGRAPDLRVWVAFIQRNSCNYEAFAPSPGEIEKLQIVAAFEEAQQRGLGVVSLDRR
jgi:citrate lyase beta subunit